jgi:hypothetical protein
MGVSEKLKDKLNTLDISLSKTSRHEMVDFRLVLSPRWLSVLGQIAIIYICSIRLLLFNSQFQMLKSFVLIQFQFICAVQKYTLCKPHAPCMVH